MSTTEQARQVGQQAAQSGQEVASNAKDGATKVANDVRQQGAQLGQEATQQVRHLAEETTSQLTNHASAQTERVANQLRQLSDQAQAFTDGRLDEAGPIPAYAQDLTDRLTSVADRLELGGVDGVVQDVRSFARRKPGTFLLIAGAAGFAAGRVLRGAKAAEGEQSQVRKVDSPTALPSEPTIYLDGQTAERSY